MPVNKYQMPYTIVPDIGENRSAFNERVRGAQVK